MRKLGPRDPPIWRRDPFTWVLPCATALAFALVYAQLPFILSGDAYAVHFPTAWALLDGEGARAFLSLEDGASRVPGYAILIALVASLTGSVTTAVPIIAVLSIAVSTASVYALLSPRIGRGPSALAVAFFVSSPSFLESAFLATPDLACLAALLAAILLVAHSSARTSAACAGVLAISASLLRLNSIYVPVLLALLLGSRRSLQPPLLPGRRLRAFALGAAIPVLGWSAVSLLVKGRPFWIPSSRGASVGYHADFLPHHKYPEQLLAESPLGFLARAAWRGLISGPIEIATHAAGLPLALAALASMLVLHRLHPSGRTDRSDRTWGLLFVLASWFLVAPVHYEHRYYVIQVLALSTCAAAGGAELIDRLTSRPWVRASMLTATAALTLIARAPVAAQFLEDQRSLGQTVRSYEALVNRATLESNEGCIGTDRHTYRLEPFRLVLRRTGAYARGCCCGPDKEDLTAFVQNARGDAETSLDPSRPKEAYHGPILERPEEGLSLFLRRVYVRSD